MRRRVVTTEHFHPRYVVWELTLKCDLACRHCGSRAGRARDQEMTVDEARDIAAQLADMGAAEVTFIGGEAYLHPHWLDIVRAVADFDIRCTMTTGARAVTPDLCARARDAGLAGMSCSVDGLRDTHDLLRAVAGSWQAALDALGHIHDAGLQPFANTQINRLNMAELPELAELLFDRHVRAWQIQLTGPMGRAADRAEWLLQPYEILDLFDVLAPIAERAQQRGVRINAGNNLGYYGPLEHLIRGEPYGGCSAGKWVLGIESNGDVKGCPSLPSAPYVGGNLRETPLRALWDSKEVAFARDRDELWGHCKGCYYADVCQGGCAWTSHTLLGRRGNMPWCHHRALELRAQGRRERLQQVERAPGTPFDFGRFELIEEPWPG